LGECLCGEKSGDLGECLGGEKSGDLGDCLGGEKSGDLGDCLGGEKSGDLGDFGDFGGEKSGDLGTLRFFASSLFPIMYIISKYFISLHICLFFCSDESLWGIWVSLKKT
jgi:hypothetical protein